MAASVNAQIDDVKRAVHTLVGRNEFSNQKYSRSELDSLLLYITTSTTSFTILGVAITNGMLVGLLYSAITVIVVALRAYLSHTNLGSVIG